MANVVRRPFADISVDGQIEPRIMSARISKGLNQNYTTAELVMPYPYPSGLRTWSNVAIIAGGDRSSANAGLHFSGHMLDPSLQMWPPRGTMLCGSQLARLENWMPPVSLTLNGLTDVQAIYVIFNPVGIFDRHSQGHGKGLGDLATQALTWAPPVDALSMVQQIDEQFGLGYRTFDTGTTVVRRFIPLSPVDMTPIYTFEEGVNCINGGFNKRRVAPAGTVVVNGDGVTATAESPTSNFTPTPYAINFIMIQQQALDAGIVSAEEMAIYLLARLTRSLVTATLTTWEDHIFSPGQVVHYKAAHLLLEQNFFVQQVIASFEGARFRQQLELISELDERTTPSGFVPIGTIDPGTMDPLDPLEPLDPVDFPDVEPPASSITASMTIVAIDREKVVISGTETEVFIVYAVDTSSAFSGTVSARAWTATGPVLSGWESGTGKEFVTAFTSLTGAAIQLQITMTGGATASVTRNLETSPGVPTKTLELFLAAGVNAEAWSPDGNAWNVDPQSAAADVEDVANGPLWTLPVASAHVMWSADYLATGATEETIAFAGSSPPERAWLEPDVSAENVAVISAGGQVALSADRGDTWTVKDGPGGNGKDVILSRFVAGQIHALTTTGYHVSDDGGNSWRTIRADTDFKWLTLSHTRNMLVTTGGVLESAETGVAQTGPSGVVCAAAHIREDRFIALTSAGRVWRTTTNGGTAMTDLAAITGTPTHAYRHGSIPDFYVYTAGAAGAFKLIIRTNAGPAYDVKILQVRSPGVGNSNAASSYSRVGIGRLVDPSAAPAAAGYVYAMGNRRLVRRNLDGTWTTLFSWTAPSSGTRVAARPGTGVVIALGVSETSTQFRRSTDYGATWTDISGSLPAGVPFNKVSNMLYDSLGRLWISVTQMPGTFGQMNSGFARSADDGDTWEEVGSTWLDNNFDAQNYYFHPGPTHHTFNEEGDPNSGDFPTYHNRYADDSGGSRPPITALGARDPAAIAGPYGSDSPALFGFQSGTGAIWRAVGTTSTQATVPSPYEIGTGTWIVKSLAIGAGGQQAVAQLFDNGGGATGKFLYSTDGGATWTASSTADSADFAGSGLTNGRGLKFVPGSDTELWALGRVSADKVARSTDGGATWTAVDVTGSPSNSGWNDLAVA